MEPKFQTSFIPKKPISSPDGAVGISIVRRTNLFSIVASVVFVMTVLVSLAMFVYKNILNEQIKKADASIAEARLAYEPEIIQDLIDASTKIEASKTLLDNHVVVSEVLNLLEELTLRRMRFDGFSYKNPGVGLPEIKMRGEVQSYNALAQQQEIFFSNEYMKDPKFSGMSLGDNGFVSVNFETKLDPTLVSYKKAIGALPTN
ncbi:MAG: hypothetical protein V4690_03950 [Patescibacteria group bacterium]